MKRFFKNNAIMLLFFASTLVVLFISIYSSTMMNNTIKMLEQNTQARMLTAARAAAGEVSAEELDAFQAPEDMDTEAYAELKQRLITFGEEHDVLFVYYLRPYGGDELQFVVDNDTDPETQVSLYDIVAMEPAPQQALGGVAATAGVGDYSVGWDGILSAFAPLYDENGDIYCIAGVDVNDEVIVSTRSQMRTLSVIQVVSLAIAIVSGFLGLTLYQRKARQSESANIAKSQFLSRMSHEIRTPMNAIIGLCRMARESDDMSIIKNYLENISTSSNHLLGLINDVLDLSKIESGKVADDTIPVVLRDEVESTRMLVKPQTEAKKQQFNVVVDAALPQYVWCDSTHLNQVVVNLLSNAVKFTPEGGRIDMDVRLLEERAGQYNVEWRVKDSGIGIEKKNIDKLFDPFEQGERDTNRKYGGTGLGLAISKQLVEMMGGTISVNSTPGQGSEFVFNVWLRGAMADDLAPRQAADGDSVDLTGRQVLLVEDSEINQLIAENIFTGMGASVDIAGNGQEGLNRFVKSNGRYAIIFMDVQMPIMDGYEATRAIRASGVPGAATVPIIAMTANVFKEDVQKALDAGMDAHVGKPFEVEQIQEAIDRALGGRRGQKAEAG